MIKIRSILLTALTSAAIAAPVMAQPYGPPPPPQPGYGPQPGWHGPGPGPGQGDWDLDHRISWIQQRIDRGHADGSLGGHEYRRVEGQMNRVRHQEHMMRHRDHGRVDGPDFDQLRGQLDQINDEIHWSHDNGDRRPW